MLEQKLLDFVHREESANENLGKSDNSRMLGEDCLTFLRRFNAYCNVFGYSHLNQSLSEEAVRIYLFHCLNLGIELHQKKDWLDSLSRYLEFLYGGVLPFKKQMFSIFQSKMQFVEIQNPMDQLHYFKKWDKQYFSHNAETRGVIPTRDDAIIFIKKVRDQPTFFVYRFTKKVYFYHGELIPTPPTDILAYDEKWNLSPSHVHLLHQDDMSFFLFHFGEGEQKYNTRLIHKSNYQLINHGSARIIDNIEFCSSLKALEQYFLDCSKDEFYQLILDEMDNWIVQIRTKPTEELIAGANVFLRKLHKLGRMVYRHDKIFQKYLREVETCIELNQLRLPENRNLATFDKQAIEPELKPVRKLTKEVVSENPEPKTQEPKSRMEQIAKHLEEARKNRSKLYKDIKLSDASKGVSDLEE